MAFCYFNSVRVNRPTRTQRRDGSSNGVAPARSERHQTALRGPVAATPAAATVTPRRDAPETSPCRHDGHAKSTARSPQGNGFDGRRRGNRDPCPACFPAKTASAQLGADSSVGPHRSIASAGGRTLVLVQVEDRPSNRSPVRGPIKTRWGQACAATRLPRSSLK
jgi:hypothetical protein